MAMTNLSAADAAIPELWGRKALRSTLRSPFWGRLTGPENSGMPIVQKFDLVQAGDVMHIVISSSLTGAGVTGEVTLAGAEEVLPITNIGVAPVFYRHGVRTNHLAMHRSAIDILAEAQVHLGGWGAAKADSVRHSAFVALTLAAPLNGETYTPNVTYSGGVGSIGAITAAMKISVDEIRKLRLKLVAQNCTPLRDSVTGAAVYGLVITPQQAYDLKSDTLWNAGVQSAGPRDASNPWMSGAIGMVDGIAIFVDPGVVTATDGSASAKVARSLAFGAEAFVEGWSEQVSFQSDQFDYGFERGTSYQFGFHPRRALAKNSLVYYCASA